ncbi:MAG: M14 family metallopeptidase [candidate division Zixibacteria bacterium]|nr:M14 family metallopeptidase [candidate division Zixibacteria bacterium]
MVFRRLFLAAVLAGCSLDAWSQDMNISSLKTRPELTDYRETSRYDDVMGFLEAVTDGADQLHLTSFGYTTEGRLLPLLVYGDVWDATPEEIRGAEKVRVFIMANIHAGEVCGKEAMLMLARSLAEGEHAEWADSLILLVAPIYNADGNEKISLYNRPRQLGPIGGMGQRPNAQGYDLNRDHIKLDSPEARSLVQVINDYDPHVVIDLHTTNGTVHAYHLTYSPPLNPNTAPEIVSFLRDKWLPTVTDRIKDEYGWDFYYYGNLLEQGDNRERGWYTFDHRPRFSNNYVGLRNRIAILSEAYSYASFEERIRATLYFVKENLRYAHDHASEIRDLTDRVDLNSVAGQKMAVRSAPARYPRPVEILLGEVEEERHPYTGEIIWRRKDVKKPEKMPEFGTFQAVESETAPRTYFVPPSLKTAIERLEAHGVFVERLVAARTLEVERFRIDSTKVADRPFQGHTERTLFGGYERVTQTLPAGTLIVPVDEALGRLVFYLLEPRSDDGLTAWGLLDDVVKDAKYYPILREPAR